MELEEVQRIGARLVAEDGGGRLENSTIQIT